MNSINTPDEAIITIYGAPWCPDCRRSKKFLSEQRIRYNWVDVDQDETARALVEAKNDGKRIIPTIIFPDGSFMVEPSDADLARKLGLLAKPKLAVYDLVIIGGGPCGLTAALYAAREGIDTLVIERSALGGQAGSTTRLENFPGFPDGLSGVEFSDRLSEQARKFGVELLQAQEVVSVIADEDGCRSINFADGAHIHAYAVLIASGASYKRLGIPGEEDFIGAGVHYCATCDGPFYRGEDTIAVIGGGNTAAEEGLHLLHFVRHVEMFVRGSALTATKTIADSVTGDPHMTVHYNTQVQSIAGEHGKVTGLIYADAQGHEATLTTHAAFVFIGQQPNTVFLRETVRLDEQGFVITGHDLTHGSEPLLRVPFPMETSVAGIFAAGDCRHGSTKQVASAVGEGASAAIAIREYLKTI